VSQAKVISLDASQSIDETMVGGKAMSLCRMKRVGLPVPRGFCITAAAFREHLESNNLVGQIKTAADKLNLASVENSNAILAEIRQVIINAPLAGELLNQIENRYRTLAAGRLAVRSSAMAEDLPEHSFAGQYETYLGIVSLADCIDAVKKCWTSLWTERAYNYRQKNGFDHLVVNMAVIIQSLIEADASGVLFTVDPRYGPSGNIVIEACFGLGQALVSGKVTPDRFVIHKKNLRLLFRAISEKKIEYVIDEEGELREQTAAYEKSTTWSLNKKQIKSLARLARKIEAEFGCPQDIEWAVYKNKIYLLQSRPITVMPQESSCEDRQIWCSSPAREVMPDVITPVTQSMLLGVMGQEFFDSVFHVLCCSRGDYPLYSIIAGRLYFNANPWGTLFRVVPGVRNFDLMIFAGSNKDLREGTEKLLTAPDEDLPDLKFSLLRFIVKLPLTIIGVLFNTPKKGQRLLAKINAKNEKWSRLDISSLSAAQITKCCQELILDFREIVGHIMYLFSIFVVLPILDKVCTKWLSEDSTCMGRLLAGLEGMNDAVAGLELWKLATSADTNPDVKHLILSDNDWGTIQLKLAQTDPGKDFLKNWDDFMDRHGHHCRAELELYNRRWSETPDYILKLLRSYITQIGKIDPIQNFNNLAQKRQQLEQQCREKLRNPLKRMIFNQLLVRSQQGSIFRENVKSEVIKSITAMRKTLVELGKKLSEKGIIRNQDDIFFLQFEEIESAVQDNAGFDMYHDIATRRAGYDKNKTIMPPDVVFGKFDPDKYVPEPVDANIETLNGLGVSPGVTTGKARVILRADTDEQVLAGEVLVAPFTDPGWTPYFVTAAAIVMDQGGILSHGSIVAREYGIPAVVNVGAATRIIKTGQTIQVDANRGVVRILR